VIEESGFRFDFSQARDYRLHDKTGERGDGNTIWSGIDFRIIEHDHEVWIEVKSWSFKRIFDRVQQTTAKKDWQKKMGEELERFRDDILQKFLGTTAYLAWSGTPLPDRVVYVVFLEPPDAGSAALLGPFRDRLRDRFKNAQARTWGRRIQYDVYNLPRFSLEFPQYLVTQA
jgi:hypothetical protein